MIKDVEEGILCLVLAGKELNVVNNQHIYHLIEMHKVIGIVVFYGIDKLYREFFRGNIQNGFAWKLFLDLDADCLGKMCFAKPYSTIYKERVKGGSSRFL